MCDQMGHKANDCPMVKPSVPGVLPLQQPPIEDARIEELLAVAKALQALQTSSVPTASPNSKVDNVNDLNIPLNLSAAHVPCQENLQEDRENCKQVGELIPDDSDVQYATDEGDDLQYNPCDGPEWPSPLLRTLPPVNEGPLLLDAGTTKEERKNTKTFFRDVDKVYLGTKIDNKPLGPEESKPKEERDQSVEECASTPSPTGTTI